MDTVLGELQWESTIAFSDDLATYSGSFNENLEHLRQLWTRLREHNVTISPKKIHLARLEVSYVGYIVGQHGIAPDPKTLEAISKITVGDINTLASLQSFLGVTGYWRRFIRDYSKIAEPLRPLLKKGGRRLHFNQEQRRALEELQKRCVTAPVLAHPDFKKPFTIMSDGSGKGIGAVLMQENEQGQLTAVAYFSKALTPAQKNYAQCEIETLALLCALELWAPYFSGTTIRYMVDCEAVKYLLRPDSKYTGRQLRWLLRLSSFDIDLQIKTSKQNVIADFLSRHPVRSEYGNHVYGVVGPLCPEERLVLRGGVLQRVQAADQTGESKQDSEERGTEAQGLPKVMVGRVVDDDLSLTDKSTQGRRSDRPWRRRAVQNEGEGLTVSVAVDDGHAAGRPTKRKRRELRVTVTEEKGRTLSRDGNEAAAMPAVTRSRVSKNSGGKTESRKKKTTGERGPSKPAVTGKGDRGDALDTPPTKIPQFLSNDTGELRQFFREHQKNDPLCNTKGEMMKKAQLECRCSTEHKETCLLRKWVVDQEDGLLKRWAPRFSRFAVVVPEAIRECVLRHYRCLPSSGHPAPNRMEPLIKRNFWWPTYMANVKEASERL